VTNRACDKSSLVFRNPFNLEISPKFHNKSVFKKIWKYFSNQRYLAGVKMLCQFKICSNLLPKQRLCQLILLI